MELLAGEIQRINAYLPKTNKWLILGFSVPVALSTGTLFVYSVYGTQLADKCQLSTSQSANLNISSTLGTAVGGILSGLVADVFGSQLPMIFTSVSLVLGYGWLCHLYNLGSESSLLGLYISMFLIGFGSTSGYFSSLKAVAISFPNFKGSAQSVTIASFAISSLIFSAVASQEFKGDIGGFLQLLSIFSGLTSFFGFLFIKIDGHFNSTMNHYSLLDDAREEIEDAQNGKHLKDLNIKESITHSIFWYHYLIFSILQGLGQMYIYSVGFILKALYVYYAHSSSSFHPVQEVSLGSLQALHVSLIALSSFFGRLSSGPMSDFLVKRIHFQRHWILVLGVAVMFLGQFMNSLSLTNFASSIETANLYLSVTSLLIGFAYGFCFSSFPVIISDIFNMKNYSFIWGLTYSSTIFGLAILTKVFGLVYDSNSDWNKSEYLCVKGSGCYSLAFEIMSMLCIIVLAVILIYIRQRSYQACK